MGSDKWMDDAKHWSQQTISGLKACFLSSRLISSICEVVWSIIDLMRCVDENQVAVWNHMDWSATRVTLCAETHPLPLLCLSFATPYLSLPLHTSSPPPPASPCLISSASPPLPLPASPLPLCPPPTVLPLSGVTWFITQFWGDYPCLIRLQSQTLLLKVWTPYN